MVTYGKRKQTDSNIQIKMGNTNLERVQHIKYLAPVEFYLNLDIMLMWKLKKKFFMH